MSVPYPQEAAAQDDLGKLVRFVRLHLGDGNEAVGKEEIDRSWAGTIKTLLRDELSTANLLPASWKRTKRPWRCSSTICTFISSGSPGGGFMTAANKSALSAADPREAGTQRRSAYSRRSGGRLQPGKNRGECGGLPPRSQATWRVSLPRTRAQDGVFPLSLCSLTLRCEDWRETSTRTQHPLKLLSSPRISLAGNLCSCRGLPTLRCAP